MVLGKKCLNLKNALAHHRVPSRVYLEWVAGGGDCRNHCVSIILGHRPQVSLSPAAG